MWLGFYAYLFTLTHVQNTAMLSLQKEKNLYVFIYVLFTKNQKYNKNSEKPYTTDTYYPESIINNAKTHPDHPYNPH